MNTTAEVTLAVFTIYAVFIYQINTLIEFQFIHHHILHPGLFSVHLAHVIARNARELNVCNLILGQIIVKTATTHFSAVTETGCISIASISVSYSTCILIPFNAIYISINSLIVFNYITLCDSDMVTSKIKFTDLANISVKIKRIILQISSCKFRNASHNRFSFILKHNIGIMYFLGPNIELHSLQLFNFCLLEGFSLVCITSKVLLHLLYNCPTDQVASRPIILLLLNDNFLLSTAFEEVYLLLLFFEAFLELAIVGFEQAVLFDGFLVLF